MAIRTFVAGMTAIAALVPATLAGAASPRDTYVRHHIAFQQNGVFKPGNKEGLTANLVTPALWRIARRSATTLSLRTGSAQCSYVVTFSTRLAAADGKQTPLEHVTAALPVPSPAYVLDQGSRGSSAAWRVTRLKTIGGRIEVRAMRADRRSLGGGEHAWQETTASASSGTGGECHAGTYRNVLGPQIGDALATMTGRAYSFTPRR